MARTEPRFPRLLRRAWATSDPASRAARRCDAEDAPTQQQRLDTRAGAYWICSGCGQLTRAETTCDLPEMYDDWWREEISGYEASAREIASARAWIRRIEPYRKTGRLFEVGVGLGLVLKTAAEAGWRPEGNELSAVAAEFAQAQCGGRIVTGEMEAIDLEPAAYDVMILDNVFEHLREPGAVLRKMATALRPGGVIFFETPSAQSLSVWCAPTQWLYYGEGHLILPTLESLGLYFRSAELEIARRETHGFRWLNVDATGARRSKKRADAVLAMVAGRIRRGHRVKMLLRKGD